MTSTIKRLVDYLLCRRSPSENKDKESAKAIPFRRIRDFSTTTEQIILLVGCICSFLGGTLQNLVLVFGGWITTVYISHGNPYNQELIEGVKINLIYMFSCGLLQLFLTYLENTCLSIYSENLSNRMRKAFVAAVLRQEAEWLESTEPGAITLQLNDNIDTVKDGLGNKVGMLIRGFSMYTTSVLICLFINWKLTLMVVPIGPLTVITLAFSEKIQSKYSKEQSEAEEKAASTFEEVLINVKTVQLCNAQEHFVEKYRRQLFDAIAPIVRCNAWLGFVGGLSLLEAAFLMGAFLWVSITLYFNSNITSAPGDILLILNVLIFSSYCLSLVGPYMSSISKARITAASICETIDRPSTIDPAAVAPLASLKGKIEFADVRFKYPSRSEEILKGLSWKAEPGQSIALVGESGCGKSTSLQLLTRMYSHTSGSITIDGCDLKKICPQSLRESIGVVEQRPCLFRGTISDNIRFGRKNITAKQIEQAAKVANAHEFIVKLEKGYDTLVGDGAVMLSGGQKQRIAIARAVLTNPKILLLDEATSALDTKSEKTVQEALHKASEGRTTIIVAHRLSTLKDVTKIFVLENGIVVESGTHVELLSQGGLYSRLAKAQDVQDTTENQEINDEEGHDEHPHKHIQRRGTENRSRQSMKKSFVLEPMKISDEEVANSEPGMVLLFGNLKGNYKKVILSFIFSMLRGTDMTLMCISFYFGFVALQHSAENYHGPLLKALLFAVVCGLITVTVQIVMFAASAWSSENVVNGFKVRSLRSLLYRPISYFDKQSPANCVVSIIQNSPQCKSALDSTMGWNLCGLTSVAGGLIIAVLFVWQMMILGAIFCALLYIVIFSNLHYSNKALKEKNDQDKSAELALELIENVKTVQMFAVEEHFCEQYGIKLDKAKKYERKIARIDSINMALTQSFVFFSDVAFYFLGTYLVYYGYYTVDIVFLSFMGVEGATFATMFTAPFFPDIIKGFASCKSVFEFIDDENKIEENLKLGETPEIDGKVSFKNVSFAYPSRPDTLVTRNLCVTTKDKEKIAFVGPSGGGKSTVLNLLTKIYEPTSGIVTLSDFDIQRINTHHLRKSVVVVGQEPVLFKGTILENITMGDKNITLAAVVQACRTANAMKFIEAFPEKFDTDVGEGGKRLSGGQRQRIAIARAIVRNPKVLLLDEATAALDAESEELVNKALVSATENATSITIAHRLKTVQDCDRIFVVENGRVVESGSHRELLEHEGHYAALVKAQKLN